jgi:outer membrane protein, heavy metal efflux system
VRALLLALGVALAAPLTEADVVAAVDARVPELAAAEAKRREAEGKRLAAQGAFDPKLKSKLERELVGPYERTSLDAALQAETPWGVGVEAGYRLGIGDFPTYYGAYDTLDGGELRLGLTASLLQDLGMPQARADRLVADELARAAAEGAQDKRQQLTGKAVSSYWKWVANGEKVALATELLALAQTRQDGIEGRVAEGALPRLDALDNGRVVLEREAELLGATRDAEQAGLALSWFLRGPDAAPAAPGAEDRPDTAPAASAILGTAADPLVARALAVRPDIAALDAVVRAAEVELRRSGVALLPRLDARGGVSQDRGAGDPKLAKTELDVGLSLEVPLAFRKGRGERARARAALERVEAERRGRRDRVSLDVRAHVLGRDAALARWRLAEAGADRAQEVARLERRAFELGGSDVFRLTKREEALAKARKTRIEAHLEYRMAEAALRTATAAW